MGWKKKRPSDFGLLERTMTHVEIRKTYACVLSSEHPSCFSLDERALTPTDIYPPTPKKTRSVRHSAAKSPAGERTLKTRTKAAHKAIASPRLPSGLTNCSS